MDLGQKRMLVTGGAGFLEQHVVRALRERGCAEIGGPRWSQYDLTREAVAERTGLPSVTKPVTPDEVQGVIQEALRALQG